MWAWFSLYMLYILVIISWRLVGSCCPAHPHHPIYTDSLGYIVRMFEYPPRSTFHCPSTQLSWYPIYNLSITPCHLQGPYYHAPMYYPMISQNFHSKIIHPTWAVNPITTIPCISQNCTQSTCKNHDKTLIKLSIHEIIPYNILHLFYPTFSLFFP